MQWWISIIKSNFIIMDSNAKIRHRLWHDTKNVSEDRTVMLKLAIKPTFENTTPEDVRWRVYFTTSWCSPWNFASNRRIHVTFVSLYFISCRIYEKWIFIISSRGYITYPDRWSGSHVSAIYIKWPGIIFLRACLCLKIMQLYWRNKQFIAREINISAHFGRAATGLWSPSCAHSGSALNLRNFK